MSNIDLGIHFIDGIQLRPFCDQDDGSKTFHLKLPTHTKWTDRSDKEQISLHVNAARVAKFERIAAAIAEIMAEDDTADKPMVEAIAAE
jgi:hypothetical protein